MGVRSPDGPKQSQRRTPKAAPRDTGCRLTLSQDGKRVTRKGLAVLAEDALRFHTGRTGREGADFSLQLDFDDMTSIEADAHAGTLTIVTPEAGEVVLDVGRVAAEWKKLIEERPNRLDDLLVKPTSRVALVAVDDEQLERELAQRVKGFSRDDGGDELDVLFMGVEHRADLAGLAAAAARVRKGGVVWAVHPIVSRKVPTGADMAAAARGVGLIAGGVVALSPTHQALQLTRV